MPRHRIKGSQALVGLALLLVAACVAPPGDAPAEGEAPVLTTRPLVVDRCQTRHVIANQPGARDGCFPVIKGKLGQWRGRAILARPRAQEIYCAYTWFPDDGNVDERPDFDALKPVTAVARAVDLDCPVLRPTGTQPEPPATVDPTVWQPLRDTFFKQADRTEPFWGPPVNVAVIDSAAHPFYDQKPDNYGHGRTLGRVISDLACPDPKGCDGRIDNRLALPQLSPTVLDPVDGGFFGTRGQLAEAIGQALDDWQATLAVGAARSPSAAHLVINLSLGWDPVADARAPSPVGVDAVRLALVRASCLGALSIAAAGNASGLTTGPIFPAAWESLPAATNDDCTPFGLSAPSPTGGRTLVPSLTGVRIGGITPIPLPPIPLPPIVVKQPKPYRPLVYAAGGVDATDWPLGSTRPGGRPRLAAYADHVVTADPLRAPGNTLILSGTSVAAAVVSGAAAAAWSASPALAGPEIMDALYANGAPLEDGVGGMAVPDFCLGGPPCTAYGVRRVAACATLKALGAAVKCDTVPAHKGTPPAVALPSANKAAPIAGSLDPIDPSDGGGAYPPPPIGGSPGDWVLPQPSWPRCTPCQISNTGILLGAFDPTDAAAPGSIVTQIFAYTNGAWQQVNPPGVFATDGGFARYVGAGSYPPGYIVFNVTYVEFGVYVRSYQTPLQSLDKAPF